MQLTQQQQQAGKPTIKSLLAGENFRRQVAMSLPKHMTPDRFVRVALTALNRQPKLAECTQTSLFQCLLDLSAMGLEPDGRRAHLIPFKDRRTDSVVCTLIVDYKGLVDLVRRSGEVSDIHADVVCENDTFDYCYGSGSHLRHKKCLGDRGKILGAYSYVRMKDGSESFEVLSKDEVEKVRRRSRAAEDGPWVSDWESMAAKTAFRRHSKWLPLSSELRERIEKDDEPAIDISAITTPPQTALPAPEPQYNPEPPTMTEALPQPSEPPRRPRGRPRRVSTGPSNPEDTRRQEAEEEDDVPMGDKPDPSLSTPQSALMAFLDSIDATFEEAQSFMLQEGIVQQEYPTVDDLPFDVCARMLRAQKGLAAGIAAMKGGAQ